MALLNVKIFNVTKCLRNADAS